ncbi:LysR substrate-binding domain-containing protein [Bacillus smithii]|uniref:LysR substrate-binding domain-containing protein n=1 Tax=Bacillus smithii TaxID=1479 RepID=UPI0030C8FB02
MFFHYNSNASYVVGLDDLAHDTLIIGESGCNFRDILEGIMLKACSQFQSVLAVSSLMAEKQFSKNSFGICKLTKSAAEEDLKRKVVALPWNGTEFVIYSDRIS